MTNLALGIVFGVGLVVAGLSVVYAALDKYGR